MKIGDRVRIKKLILDECTNEEAVDMKKYIGKIATIMRIAFGEYTLNIDEGKYAWLEAELELVGGFNNDKYYKLMEELTENRMELKKIMDICNEYEQEKARLEYQIEVTEKDIHEMVYKFEHDCERCFGENK